MIYRTCTMMPDKTNAIHLLTAFILVMLICALWPFQDAFASVGGGSGGGNCQGEGLLARIVPCITNAMEQSTTKIANSISSYLWPIIGTFIVFVIIIYGVKIMSPEGNPQKTAIPLLLKIGFVLLFVQNFGGFTPAVTGGLKEVVDILANALDMSSQCSGSGGGGGGGGGGAASMGSDKVWKAMDCVLGKLFGFAGKDGNATLIASIFGLAAGFFFGGSFGMIAFFSIIGVLWSILMFVFKAAFAFLNGFMLACFSVIISPIFIPLILMQAPGQYFARWYQLLISAFLMPLLVVGYCIFALSIYNKVLFEGERAEAIRKTMEKSFSESITGMRTECLGTLLNNIFYRIRGGTGGGGTGTTSGGGTGNADQILRSASVPNVAIPQQSGGQGLCIKVPNIDMQKLTGKFKNKQDFFRQIFTDGAALFLLAWLLSKGLQAIIDLSSILAGSAAGKLMGPLSDTEKRLKSAMDNAKQRMTESFQRGDGSSVAGPEFLQRVIPGIRDGLSGFTGGLRG